MDEKTAAEPPMRITSGTPQSPENSSLGHAEVILTLNDGKERKFPEEHEIKQGASLNCHNVFPERIPIQ